LSTSKAEILTGCDTPAPPGWESARSSGKSIAPSCFFENGVSYKRYLSIYHSLQADSPRGNPAVAAPGAGISRSFLTVRVQPAPRIDFDFNHTYFRDIPTFDPQLVGTGLLDKYLFQGFSVGATRGSGEKSLDLHESGQQPPFWRCQAFPESDVWRNVRQPALDGYPR